MAEAAPAPEQSAPERLSWDAPAPPGTRAQTRAGPLNTAAIALFTPFYGISFIAGVACGVIKPCAVTDHDLTLLVPVFGPFIQMGVTQSVAENILLAGDGLAQGAAVMMFVAARLFPQRVLVKPFTRPRVAFAPAPLGGPSTLGLEVVGVF